MALNTIKPTIFWFDWCGKFYVIVIFSRFCQKVLSFIQKYGCHNLTKIWLTVITVMFYTQYISCDNLAFTIYNTYVLTIYESSLFHLLHCRGPQLQPLHHSRSITLHVISGEKKFHVKLFFPIKLMTAIFNLLLFVK